MRNFFILLAFAAACLSYTGCKYFNFNDKSTSIDSMKGVDPKIISITNKIKDDPQNPELYYTRGALYYQSNNLDLAAKDLYKATQLDSTQTDYFSLLADVNADARYIRQAITYYQRALQLSPADKELKIKLAKMYLYLKEYDASVATLNELLSTDRFNPKALLLKGICYKERGDSVKAMNFFKDVVAQDPDNYDAWMQLGMMASHQHNPLAEKYFQNTLRLDSDRYEGNYALAMYYQQQGADAKAKDIYKRMILHSPQNEQAIFNLAFMYYNEDSLQQALQHFTICVQVAPENADAYYWRGIAYRDLNRIPQARQDFLQALNIKQDMKAAKEELDKLGGNVKK